MRPILFFYERPPIHAEPTVPRNGYFFNVLNVAICRPIINIDEQREVP